MSVKQWQLAGALFTFVVGTLLHFTYQWSGENTLVGTFSAVNESTWEHLKLLYTPVLLFGIAEYFFYGNKLANFVPVKVISILLGMAAIVASFYTYVGIVGQHFLWADIATFLLGVVTAYWFSAHFLQTENFSSPFAVRLGWIGLILLVAAFTLFTFYPPHIALFLDSTSGTYGSPLH